MKNRSVRIYTLLLFFLLAFIWGNSLLPDDSSSSESAAVAELLRPALELVIGKGRVSDHFVRKLAHFGEFAALGLVFCLLETERHGCSLFTLSYAFFASVSTAVADESIQLLTPGRSAQITDVLLDSAGAFVGILLAAVVPLLIHCIAENS